MVETHDRAVRDRIFNAVVEGRKGLVSELAERFHVNISNIKDDEGNSLVALAALRKDAEMVRILC
jgi:hypothetical protein